MNNKTSEYLLVNSLSTDMGVLFPSYCSSTRRRRLIDVKAAFDKQYVTIKEVSEYYDVDFGKLLLLIYRSHLPTPRMRFGEQLQEVEYFLERRFGSEFKVID